MDAPLAVGPQRRTRCALPHARAFIRWRMGGWATPVRRVVVRSGHGCADQVGLRLPGGRVFANSEELLRYLKNEDVKFVDVRFCDLPG
ncbi:hypothetical protein, partial [Micromonospora sp. NPDC005161]